MQKERTVVTVSENPLYSDEEQEQVVVDKPKASGATSFCSSDDVHLRDLAGQVQEGEGGGL